MIPIRDTISSRRKAWMVRLLVAANIAAFVFELRQGPRIEAFLYEYGIVPAAWSGGRTDLWALGDFARSLITSQFLHGSLLHIGSNVMYLWIFGDNVEDRLGSWRFLALYIGSGVVAGLAQFMANPHATVPMIGASGAIAGVLGAYFLLFPYSRIVTLTPIFGFIELPAFIFLGLWFLLQWMQGAADMGRMADVGGVAWWAHVGGFVSGLLFVTGLRAGRRYA